MMSDTPRTDALVTQWDDDGASRGAAYADLRDLARTLERELNEAIARAEALYKANVSATMVYEEWSAECKARAEMSEADAKSAIDMLHGEGKRHAITFHGLLVAKQERDEAIARAEKAELAHQSAVDAIKDEIACNHEFMAKGGARHDENITQFQERLIAERDAALAKVARYETLRPMAEYDNKPQPPGTVLFWDKEEHGVWAGWADRRDWHTHWTPLPDVKEAKP